MSSLKNAAKSTQRTHKERHQPSERSEFGLLEKKKDYKLRAKDYNEKKATLRKLRKKALNKNPDEFYFHMVNSKIEGGVHKEKSKEETLTPEQVKLMQTQDLRYIVHKRSIEQRKIEKLKASLHLLEYPSNEMSEDDGKKQRNTHTFFVDNEKDLAAFDPVKQFGTHPSLLGRKYNRPKIDNLKDNKMLQHLPTDQVTVDNIRKNQHKAYKELNQRIERERQLGILQAKMEAKKQLANKKGEKPIAVIKEETKESAPIFKWPAERKR